MEVLRKRVLRAVSLPSDLDEVLRVLAFHRQTSLNELLIQLLQQGVEGDRKLLDKVAPGLLPTKE